MVSIESSASAHYWPVLDSWVDQGLSQRVGKFTRWWALRPLSIEGRLETGIQFWCFEGKLVSQSQLCERSLQPNQAVPLQGTHRVSERQEHNFAAPEELTCIKSHVQRVSQRNMWPTLIRRSCIREGRTADENPLPKRVRPGLLFAANLYSKEIRLLEQVIINILNLASFLFSLYINLCFQFQSF
jgi:hypothetical protein